MPVKEAGRAVLIHDRPKVVPVASPLAQALAALDLVGRDPRQALADADSTVVAARAARDRGALSVALRAAALAHHELGQVPAALADGRESVRVAVRASDGDLEAEARMSLAFVLLGHGSVAAALRQADRAAALGHGVRGARVATQRALILQRTGRHQEALAGYAQALPALRRAGDTTWEARLRNNRGLLHAYHGSLRDAETDLRRALDLHEAAGSAVSTADTWWNLGFVASRRGDAPTALQHFDAAAEIYRQHAMPVPELLVDRAELLIGVGAFGEARLIAATAVTGLRGTGLGLHLPEALLLLAQASVADHDPGAAGDAAREAARLFDRQQRPAWAVLARYVHLLAAVRDGQRSHHLLQSALVLADELARSRWRVHELDVRLVTAALATALGKTEVAQRELGSARAARRSTTSAVAVRAWYAEALLHVAHGRTQAADRALRTGMRHLEQHRAAMGATELRMHAAGHGREAASLGLTLALDARSPARVLAWAEAYRAGTLRLHPVRPPRDEVLADTLADLRRATAAAEAAALDGAPSRRLDSVVDALEAEVRHHTRQARGRLVGDGLPAGNLAAVRGALGRLRPEQGGTEGAGTVLVELVRHEADLWAVVVTRQSGRLHHLGSADAAGREAEQLAVWLRRLASNPPALLGIRALAAARDAAAALDSQVLRPLEREIGTRDVVVVPTTGLSSVAWSMLPSLHGRPVSVAPSAAIWLRSTAPETAPRPRRQGGTKPVVTAVAGPRLAAAEREATAVAAVRCGIAITGPRATATAVLRAMEASDTVHIAAHGRLRSDNPLLSALELADGPLTVYDLERLNAVPRVVLLPACRSGLSAAAAGEELLGLSHALLALGCRSVVATVVSVPDEATGSLMADLHGQLASGVGLARALASVQAPLTAGNDPAAAAAAAGFVCFGSGGSAQAPAGPLPAPGRSTGP